MSREGNRHGRFIRHEPTGADQEESMHHSMFSDIRAVFDASHHFMGVLSHEGVLLDANRTALDLAGYSLQEVQGRPFWETQWWTHDPLQQARLREGIQQAARGDSFRMETTHTNRDGKLLVIDFTIRPLRDASGRVVALLPEGQDMTDLAEKREQLRVSEIRFRSLLEHAPEAIVMLDCATGRFLEVNAQAEVLFQATREQLLKLGPAQLSPPSQPDGRASVEAASDHLRQAIERGTATFDWTHQTLTGQPVPCEVRLLKLPGLEGDLVRGSLVDLRPRLEKDSHIWESERKFRLLFERSVDGLLVLDGDRFTDCNQAALDMLRCTELEFRQLHPWDLSPPVQPDGRASDEKAMEMMAMAYAKGVHRFEWMHRRMTGEDFPVEVTLIPIPLGGKDILYTSWQDITGRKANEQALEENAHTIGLIVEQTDQMVYDFDVATGKLRWFGALERLIGRSAEALEAAGLPGWRNLLHPEDRESAAHRLDTARQEGGAYRVQYRLMHRDGSERWVEDSGVARIGSGGEVARMLGSVKDISERKLAEQERLGLERQMLHAQKLESLGVLAGGIAHDFNNLLTAILANLNLAEAGLPEASPVRPKLKAMERAALKAAGLTRQMLAYSGKGKFVVKIHDLNQVVREMTNLLQASIAKKIKLDFALEDGLPFMEADEAQLQQIILNLVTNASDAIGDKAGVIRIASYAMQLDEAFLSKVLPGQALEPGPYTILEVGDSGVGMAPEVQAKIFDPFFTTKPAGHGLGLSAIQGILKGHHAGMRVYSEVGRGTNFQIYFPSSSLPLVEDLDFLVEEGVPFSGLVLLVDDESSIREVTAQALVVFGFEVETAADGMEAVEKFLLRPDAYRLVLLDLTMPRMDGRECFKALRAIRPGLPAILCSGFSEQESVKELFGEGLKGFIQKPYTLNMLRDAFTEALRA